MFSDVPTSSSFQTHPFRDSDDGDVTTPAAEGFRSSLLRSFILGSELFRLRESAKKQEKKKAEKKAPPKMIHSARAWLFIQFGSFKALRCLLHLVPVSQEDRLVVENRGDWLTWVDKPAKTGGMFFSSEMS